MTDTNNTTGAPTSAHQQPPFEAVLAEVRRIASAARTRTQIGREWVDVAFEYYAALGRILEVVPAVAERSDAQDVLSSAPSSSGDTT